MDCLGFFKNYFVTGDYVVGGVGLRGLGGADGLTTGTSITIPDPNYSTSAGGFGPKAATFVPDGADIVAAYLYWQTVEKTQSTFAGQKGFFNGYGISGKILGNPNAPTSWSAGGCGGSNQGATTLRTYRADVRPFLPVVNGKHQGNGTFPVRLADSGSNGGGAPLTLGATLVIIYRLMVPPGNTDPALSSVDAKLRAISLYDGSFAPGNGSATMSQTIKGFYQAASISKLTHIVGNGQSNKDEKLYFNTTVIAGSPSTAAFPGLLNGSWDNPTYDVTSLMGGVGDSVATSVIPAATNTGCVSWGAVIFGTTVQNSGAGAVSGGPLSDGLVDVWKTIPAGQATPGFFDVKDGSFVPLPGANDATKRHLFIQIDYMCSVVTGGVCDPSGHVHLPKQAALDRVGDAFLAQGIQVHFDVGPNYQNGDPYIVPAASASGGNIIDENAASVTCVESPGAPLCQFPGDAATSWKGGFSFLKNQPLNYADENACEAAGSACIRRFRQNRRFTHHEVIFGHALGRAATNWRVGGVNPMLLSIVNAGTTATVTTASGHGLSPGARVTVSGAIADADLDGTYVIQSVPAMPVDAAGKPTTFTITTAKVTDGTYDVSRNPGLTVSTGLATSNSGWSDVGGADTIVTFGKWRWDDLPGCQPNPAVALAAGQVYCNDHVGTVEAQANTLIHEVGHTLGLTHGGAYITPSTTINPFTTTPGINITYGPNCKPNFLSSMNYAFQFHGSGLPGYDGLGHANYSVEVLPDLNEGILSEPNGIGNPAAFPSINSYRTRWFAPPSPLDSLLVPLNQLVTGRPATMHCNGTTPDPSEPAKVLVEGPLAPGAIDWNNDGDTLDTAFALDINFNGTPNSNVNPVLAPDSPFAGFDDWNKGIDLRQIGARRGVLGFSADVWGGDTDSFGGDTDSFGGDADSFGGDADSFGGDTDSFGGDTDSFGGDADSFGGSVSQDFNTANASVDPPLQLTCSNCVTTTPPAPLIENGKSAIFNWKLPGFGRIRVIYVWRFNGLPADLSASNKPVNIGTVGKLTSTTPPATTFSDGTIKNGNTYTYFVTAALGNDSAPNSGNQSGRSNMVTITVTFSTKNSTTTTVASNKNPSTFGDSVTFTATVSPSPANGELVTFKDGTVTLGTGTLGTPGSGKATFTTSNLPGGMHSITATYPGDTNNSGSTSTALSQTVNKGGTTTGLTSSLSSPVPVGASVTFTATVSPASPATATPTGTVTFYDGAANLGSRPLNASGVATFSTSTLAVGMHSITASYGGDGNYNVSTSTPALPLTVTASDFSISASPSSQRVKAGSNALYTVTITPSGGFAESVTLSMTSSPAGPTATFGTNPVTGGSGSTAMTVTVPAKGTFTLTIKGTSSPSGLVHSTVVTVIGN